MSRDGRDMLGSELSEERTIERLSVLAEALEPVAPSASVRLDLLRQLEGAERWTPHASRIAEGFGLPLAEVTDALRRIGDEQAWQPGSWPGSRQLVADALARANTVVAVLPAGYQFARHRHETRELTYVLDGELIEDGKNHHGQGTLLELLPGTEHEVAASDRGSCMVVFGLRFAG